MDELNANGRKEHDITQIRCCFVYMFHFATFTRHLHRLHDRNAEFAKFLIVLGRVYGLAIHIPTYILSLYLRRHYPNGRPDGHQTEHLLPNGDISTLRLNE